MTAVVAATVRTAAEPMAFTGREFVRGALLALIQLQSVRMPGRGALNPG